MNRQILVPNRTNHKPFLILGAVAVLVVCTVLFRSWRSRRGELPQVALVGRTEGIPALKAGRFDHAYQLLSAAKDAVNALGGAVEEADEIRHAADEASIYVDLLSDPLESLLEEAARSNPQSWADRFDKIYKGRSVIIDGNITATPETNPNKRYAIDYLVVPPGEGQVDSRRGRIDLSSLEFVSTVQPKVGDRLVFGARLADFKYDSAAGEFVISFDPKSGISMQYYEALQAQGWPSGAIILDDFPSESEKGERQ